MVFLKQIQRSVTKKFEMFLINLASLPFSATYFLEVGARISLKNATKGSIILEVNKL